MVWQLYGLAGSKELSRFLVLQISTSSGFCRIELRRDLSGLILLFTPVKGLRYYLLWGFVSSNIQIDDSLFRVINFGLRF